MASNAPRARADQMVRFWREAPEKTRFSADYVASQHWHIPEAAHVRFKQDEMKYFYKHILSGLPRGGRVLDLGCGPGRYAMAASSCAESVLGVDISPSFVAHARQQAAFQGLQNVRFEVDSATSFAAREKYDLIILTGVLMYVVDGAVEQLLQRIRDSLTPQGVLYVRVSTSPEVRVEKDGKYNVVYRTLEEYAQLFSAAGFAATRERDIPYSHANILDAWFAALDVVTFGLVSRRTRWGDVALNLLEWLRPLTIHLPQWFVDRTRARQSYHHRLVPPEQR